MKMIRFNRERWMTLTKALGLQNDPEETFRELHRRYSEPHRHYHNARHIDECLELFDSVRSEARDPLALESAIWFHDVVYDPRANDNEEKSANFALLHFQGLSSGFLELLIGLILATKTHMPGMVPDAALLIDIDLSILGKPSERFAEFESAIRNEYAWVMPADFCKARAYIVRGFLERDRIYHTNRFSTSLKPPPEKTLRA